MAKLAAFLLSSLTLLIQQYMDQYRREDLQKTLIQLQSDLGLPRIQTYDFIIVGGGVGGCQVAGRLSEFFSVLLLETGGNPPPAIYSQYLVDHTIQDTLINYIFPSRSELSSLQAGGMLNLSQGKMMGGSGSHNINIYNRGSPLDYDYIAGITGDASWSYINVLKHFKRFENFQGILLNESQRWEYYNNKGQISVTTDTHPLLRVWLEAGRELGYRLADPNGYRVESFTTFQKSTRNSEKSSSYSEFIAKVENSRPNLKVLRYSQVQKVLINQNKIAYGVTYLRHGIPQIAHASREVILSAGAIMSPLMLLKSGIGQQSALQSANIPIVQDLPGVGKNFMDHERIELIFRVNNLDAASSLHLVNLSIEEELVKYHSYPRRGVFTEMLHQQAFIVSERAKTEGEWNWPDLHLVLNSRAKLATNTIQFAFYVALGRPKSRGVVELNNVAYKSGDFDDQNLVKIDRGTFTFESDIDVIVEGIRLIFKIVETKAFKQFDLEYDGVVKECQFLRFGSDEYWKCYVMQVTKTFWHYSGTCRMGQRDDPLAVVDSELRVRGIQNLRVVDASALPFSTSSNTNAPTMLLAEKASCSILRQHLFPHSDDLELCPLDHF